MELPGFSVRMVTYLTIVKGWWESPQAVERAAFRLAEAVDRASETSGLRPDSVRLTLQSAPSLREAAGVAEDLGQIAEDSGVYVNAGLYSLADSMAEAASLAREGVYFSLAMTDLTWREAEALATLMNRVAEEDPVNATRLAVNLAGEPVETPYYPLSSLSTPESMVAVGLTYPNRLAAAFRAGGLKGIASAAAEAGIAALSLAKGVARELGARRVGVDLSVSPWMKESTLGLVELVAGVRLPEPGIAWGIRRVNEAVREAALRLGGDVVGFNSVQLPVAEDLKLKARVSEGDTTARDLARLAGVCLAGLDMAAVPYEPRRVAGLILEVGAYARAKGAPLGVRLIPLEDVEPGDRVALGRFGELPVMPV